MNPIASAKSNPEKHPPLHTALSGEVDLESVPVTSVLEKAHVHPVITDHVLDSDEEALAALGYKQEFKREFGLFSTFCVSFALLGLLPSIASTIWYGMGYAGTAGMVWGWLIAMIGIQAVASSMAELCSSMPTSGGLYYASAVLAPPKYGPLAAWITGWSNWLCQVSSSPSIDYSLASMLLALKSMHDPHYEASNYQIFLLTVAIMIVQSAISSMPTGFLAHFNTVGTIINAIGLFIALFVIIGADNRTSQGLPRYNSSSDVWGTIYNQTDWPDGIAILMSFISIIWTMSGYDSPFHLSEECSNANIASPRAIVMTSISGGILGWAFMLAIAYTVVNIELAIDDSLGQPFVGYLTQCLSTRLVYFITALTIISSFFMGQASMIAASRVCYAYSRDGCFPCSWIMATVNKRTKTPVNAVWFNTLIGILLLLLIFAGEYAIGAIFSVGAIAAYIAFVIPIGLKVFVVGNNFRPGPWNLGRWSRPCGYLSVAFVLLMTPILCFPEYRGKNNNAQSFNWTVVVYFVPMLLSILWFFVYAHKFFKGPKVNLEHAVYANEEAPLEGVEIILPGSKSTERLSNKEHSVEPIPVKDLSELVTS